MLYSNTMRIFILFIILSFFSVSSSSAQDATAASLYNEGFALIKQKSYEEGLALLEKALVKAEEEGKEDVIKLSKKNGAVAAYNVGNTKRKAGALDEAMTFYNKAISLNPENSSSFEGVARVLEAKGKKLEAVSAYVNAAQMATTAQKAKRAASRYKKARTMVGKMFVAKEYDNAIAAGTSFIAVNDDDADVHYYMSKSLAEKGDNETASSHMTKAITLKGADVPAKYLYAQGQQLEKLGKKQDAVAAYKKITDAKYKKQADYRISELSK